MKLKQDEFIKGLIPKLQEKEIIEYTEYAGAKTTYSKLNDREAETCAKIAFNFINHLLSKQVVQSEVSDSSRLEEALQLLLKLSNKPYFFYVDEVKEIAKLVHEQANLTPPDAEKWISVDEKPKTEGYYNVAFTSDSKHTAPAYWDGDDFLHTRSGNKYLTVTHWMPLPKPPINKQGGK
jgi:hypothetical protein